MNFFRPYEVKLSADKRYLLMKKSYHRVFRRSSHGTYDILDLHSGIMTHLKPTNWSKKDDEFQVRYISWAPRDNGLVYVDFDNNVSNLLFLREIVYRVSNIIFYGNEMLQLTMHCSIKNYVKSIGDSTNAKSALNFDFYEFETFLGG